MKRGIFIHSLDLVRARPLPGLVKAQPAHTLDVVFGVAGEEVVIYLADEREAASARGLPDGDAIDRGAGQPITGEPVVDLPDGAYQVACFDPKTGRYPPSVRVAGRASCRLTLPVFVHDLVVYIGRA